MIDETKRRAESGNDRMGYTPLRSRFCQLDVECEVSASSHHDDGLIVPPKRHPYEQIYSITQTVVLQTNEKTTDSRKKSKAKTFVCPRRLWFMWLMSLLMGYFHFEAAPLASTRLAMVNRA